MQVEKVEKMLKIYLEEKNIASDGYDKQYLEFKGFFMEVEIQDFSHSLSKGCPLHKKAKHQHR